MNHPISTGEATDIMTCFECNSGELIPARVSLSGARHGETFAVETEGLKCNTCGFASLDSEQSGEFTRLISDAYREKHGLLTSIEIHARRVQLGMTQLKFSEHLGTGVASVKRWEAGHIQEKAMDELIRLKTDPGAARKNLRMLEQQVPEPFVLFEGQDVSFTLAMAETHYLHTPKMKMQSVSIPQEQELEADACMAA